jgi:hypothetical protein
VRRLGTWLLVGTALVACENAPTQIVVRFEAEPVSAARARSLHVRVLGQEGVVRLDRTIAVGDGPGQVRFPTRVPIVPIGGDSSRVFRVEAELLDASDTAFSEQRAILGFVRDQLFEVTILFDDACIGQLDCPDETTCRDSVCVDARIPVGEPGPAGRSERQIGECTSVCWENPRPAPNFLTSVCADPVLDLAIAAGAGGRVYERIDGIWNSVGTGTGVPAHDIACLGDGAAVTVGHMGAVAVRSDGAWTVETSGAAPVDLHAVAGDAREVWAVGDGGLVFRRRAGAWERIDAGTTVTLLEVAYASPTEVWVSGAAGTLLRFDGISFAPVAGPLGATPHAYDQMTLVRDGLLVRSADTAMNRPIYLRHADGTWTFEFSEGLGVTDLSSHPSGWVAGPGGRGALYVRTPESAWENVGETGGDNLTGAAAGDGFAYYVGPQGEIARWSRETGMTFEVERATEQALADVSAHPTDPIFAVAVGAGGTIVERVRAGVWRPRTIADGETTVPSDLFGTHVTDTSAIAVGDAGVIAERDATGQWVRVPSPVTARLLAVHASAERAIAVGAAATVLERVDGTWRALGPAPTPDDLTAVLVRGSRAFAGTSTGEILRLDGTTWTSIGRAIEPGRATPLVVGAIRGDASAVFAAIGRSLYRVDESSIAMLPAPTSDGDADDVGVWMGHPRYAVTRALWIDDGTGWVTTNAEADAIAVTSEGVGLIVGANGYIARTR